MTDSTTHSDRIPGWAVILVSQRTEGDNGYGETMQRMLALGSAHPGFISLESVRAPDGRGITVVFYESEEAAKAWGRNSEHRATQKVGRAQWYEHYAIYHARVERGHRWNRGSAP